MAREQGFQITIRAWAKVDKTKPQTMIAGAELAEGKSVEHALSALGLIDISVSSVYTSKVYTGSVAPSAPPPAPEAPLLDPLDIPPDLDRRQKP